MALVCCKGKRRGRCGVLAMAEERWIKLLCRDIGIVFPPLPRGEDDGRERGVRGVRKGLGEDAASQKNLDSLSGVLGIFACCTSFWFGA